jgi:hypothetical protein
MSGGRFINSGRAASVSGGGTTTLEIDVESDGTWPEKGALDCLMIRQTAGSATKYSWGLYSEDPTSLPAGTETWEFLLAGAFDASGFGGSDNRPAPSANASIPDVFIEFETPKAWIAKSTTAIDKLWLVLTPDAGADNEWTTRVLASPRRVRLGRDEVPGF